MRANRQQTGCVSITRPGIRPGEFFQVPSNLLSSNPLRRDRQLRRVVLALMKRVRAR